MRDSLARLGRDVVCNLTGIPIIEGGEVIGVLAVMNDITEKRTLQSQVAETRGYLQNLIDNANDIIYTLDREGRVMFINKLGQKVTGHTCDPAEKTHHTDDILKKDLAKNEKHSRQALTGKAQRHESTLARQPPYLGGTRLVNPFASARLRANSLGVGVHRR